MVGFISEVLSSFILLFIKLSSCCRHQFSRNYLKQMIIDSNHIFKEIDYDRVSKYLGEYMTIEEILEEEMEDLLYIEQNKLEKLKIVKQVKEK